MAYKLIKHTNKQIKLPCLAYLFIHFHKYPQLSKPPITNQLRSPITGVAMNTLTVPEMCGMAQIKTSTISNKKNDHLFILCVRVM